MKIMHIGQMIGGLDIYIRNSIMNCKDELMEFVIVCGKDDKHQPVIRKGKAIREHHISLYRNLNPLHDFTGFLQVIRCIVKEKPDIIHCHSAKGGIFGRVAGWLTGKKTFYTAHAFSFLCTSSHLKRQIFLFLERLTKMNAYLLACSESERMMGIQEVKYSEDHALLWHNSVPDINLPPEGNCRQPQDPYICYIGRPCYQKNTLFLTEVMKQVKARGCPLKLQLLGVGYYSSELAELKEAIKNNGLKDTISLQPWISHDECLQLVKQSMFYISTSRYEGLPLSIIEAMSLGKAIIASDVVGNKDCVSNGINGYLLPLQASLFAEKIVMLWKDEKKRKELETESRKIFVSDFCIDTQIDKLFMIYNKISSNYICSSNPF